MKSATVLVAVVLVMTSWTSASLADNPRIKQLQRRHVERFHPHRSAAWPMNSAPARSYQAAIISDWAR